MARSQHSKFGWILGVIQWRTKVLQFGICAFLCPGLAVVTAYGQQGGDRNKDRSRAVDSLITNKGDVYTGHYNKPVFGHSSFSYNGKKHPLDAQAYQAYKHDGVWYKSVQLSSAADPVWMECLERGAIELYQYISYGAATRVSPRNLPQSYVVWLASKRGGTLLNVNGVMASEAKAKENVHRLLVDQPDLAAELENVPFNTRVIRGLIAAYNRRVEKTK